ncbi:MAG: glycosyltransferase [Melioribacteraceae bacterium]|nr:glycosyltransferase [Melioribacteraceae bacterium]
MTKISLCMIVKNEEKYLSECLESVKNIVDEIIIVDTGSTDNTIDIAKNYNAKVFHFDWINDFSAARNFSISQATGNWILYLDADERLDASSVSELKRLTNQKQKTAYNCIVRNIDSTYGHDNSNRYPRLFPNNEGIKFEGKVHEQISNSLLENKIDLINANIIIVHIGYDITLEEKKKKAERNLTLLLQEFSINKSPYIAYQLGLTYQIINDVDNALNYLRIAAENVKLERNLRAICFTQMAFINHQNHKVQEAERNILLSLKLDERQPFSYYLASKISLRKNELTLAEEKCKRAYLLNQDQLLKEFNQNQIIHLDPEEVIFYGITLALQNRNTPNYQFYQKELYQLYTSHDGKNSLRAAAMQKVFLNSSFTIEEGETLIKMINQNNIGFFIFMFGNNPYKQQILLLVEKLIKKFPESVEVKKLLAKLLDEFGRLDEAIKILENVIVDDQKDPSIYFYLITYYLKQGSQEKIKPVIAKLEKNFSNIPEVMTRVRTLKRKLLMLTTVPL